MSKLTDTVRRLADCLARLSEPGGEAPRPADIEAALRDARAVLRNTFTP